MTIFQGIKSNVCRYEMDQPSNQAIPHIARIAKVLVFSAATLFAFSGSGQIARAADGALDPTFGSGGKVVTDVGNSTDYLSQIAVQADGKIVAIGSSNKQSSNRYTLLRYNPNGTLDPTFGNGGKVVTEIASGENADALLLLPNGKIMIAGSIGLPNNYDDNSWALLRYNADGSLDSSFGNGGLVTTNIGTYFDFIGRIALQPDGKIVAAGTKVFFTYPTDQKNSDVALARYNTDGSLDTTFGNGGIVISDFVTGLADNTRAMIIQPDAKIIVAGESAYETFVARYNKNGTLDATFGNNGFTSTDMCGNLGTNFATGVALQPDGKIVLVGDAECQSPYSNFEIARYNSNGTLDQTFGNLGKLVFGSGELMAVVIQRGDKIIALGDSGNTFSLFRFNTNGSLDTTFGNNGIVSTSFASEHVQSESLTFQPDGNLVAGGYSEMPYYQNSDFALARYLISPAAPTAGPATISGQISAPDGTALSGAVVTLTGSQSRKTITDANGNYRFDNVETSGFYTLRPSRTNYSFNPAERSFSQIGNTTEAMFTGSPMAGAQNPLDTPEYFVRQHYIDFLGREPDEAGFNFWSDQILSCGADAACVERRIINVSAAYFLSIEFQQTGGLVDGLYRASYGARPTYAEFMPDTRAVGQGVIVGNQGWEAKLQANKEAFVNDFVNRPAFHQMYDGMDNSLFVDTLISHTGVTFTSGERDALVIGLTQGTMTRGGALWSIAENSRFVSAKFNETFVMMEYFGYLRRDPDASGFAFWLNKLNEFNGNFEQAEMVKAFIVSGEYRDRFPR